MTKKKNMTQSMRILHTADWHLGKKLDGYLRLPEQREVMTEIIQIADEQSVDAVLIAGDIFDNVNPTTEAEDLLYSTVSKLAKNGKRAVIVIAGNHDSAAKIESTISMARTNGVFFCGYPESVIKPIELESGLKILNSESGFTEIQLPNSKFPLRIIHTPYAHFPVMRQAFQIEDNEISFEKLLNEFWNNVSEKYCDQNGVNVLITHLFVTSGSNKIPEESDDEKSILHIGGVEAITNNAFPKEIQYVALGHLHRNQIVAQKPCPIVYSSSPLSYSMNEADQQKYVVVLEAEPNKPIQFENIPLKSGRKLLRKTVETIEEAEKWLTENKEAFVELSIKLNNEMQLSAEIGQRLHKIHDRLLRIIPIVEDKSKDRANKTVDLTQSMEKLFEEYYVHLNQRPVEKDVMEIFKEVLRGDI